MEATGTQGATEPQRRTEKKSGGSSQAQPARTDRIVKTGTGRSVSAGRLEGRDIEVVQRYTDVFVRQGGRWRIVASQGTQVQ